MIKHICISLLMVGILRAGPETPILPATPDVVLKCLPGAPEGWKLIKSRGENVFSEWLITESVREFESLPVVKPEETEASLPKRTTIRVTDTGFWKSEITMAQGNLSKGATESAYRTYPLIKVSIEGKLRRMLCVKDRFLVVVETQNQSPKEAEEWLDRIDYAALETIPNDGATELPQPLKMSIVDEMDPSQTRTYSHFRN